MINVRVERREHRDLQQDLRDIAAGIDVVHASDEAAAARAQKSERRKKAAASRAAKLERLVCEKGYDNLETIERIRADRVLGAGCIRELEKERRKPPSVETQVSFL